MPEISEADLKSLNDAKAQLTTLSKTMEGLKGELDKLKDVKSDLERKLDDADRELLSESYLDFKDKKGKTRSDPNLNDKDFDYDRASPAEIAVHLKGSSAKELEKAVKLMAERVEKTEEMIGKAFARMDVSMTSMKHTDFETNKEAIFKVAKANPSWNAEKCYNQWKLESDATAKETRDAATKKAEDDAKLLTEKDGGIPVTTVDGKELSEEDAGAAAYEQAFGNAEKT